MSAAASALATRLLLIDRDPELVGALGDGAGLYQVQHAICGRGGLAALRTGAFDVVIADLDSLADIGDADDPAVARLARLGGQALIVVLSRRESISAAVAALQSGAHDCLTRPIGSGELGAAISALRLRHQRRFVAAMPGRPAGTNPTRLVTVSPQMQLVADQMTRIAASTAPIFITGESGTGKRLAAETLHALSPMATLPFVAADSLAMARSRPLSADDRDADLRPFVGSEGWAMLAGAGGGTLYFHEIGALSAPAQARLLRLVEPGGGQPEMDHRPITLRIVCATRQNPATLMAGKMLRQDLYYRLNVLPIHLPPLRQRREDVAPLARQFLARLAREADKPFRGFTPGALAFLAAHDWPGNVRHLENLVRRVVEMFSGFEVSPQMLAAADIEALAGKATTGRPIADAAGDILPMWREEQRIIEAAIARFGGNIARAAEALEISPSTIYRKKQAWDEMATERKGVA